MSERMTRTETSVTYSLKFAGRERNVPRWVAVSVLTVLTLLGPGVWLVGVLAIAYWLGRVL